MSADLTPAPPRTIDGYLQLAARAIFAAGLAWSTVEARWPDIREAFDGMSARSVAAYREADIERLLAAPGVVRNRAKIEAVVAAARLLSEARDRHGSVNAWLRARDGYSERARALRAIPFIGSFGAFYVLAVAGFDVPHDWRAEAA